MHYMSVHAFCNRVRQLVWQLELESSVG